MRVSWMRLAKDGQLGYRLGGATDKPRTLCFSISLATRPDDLACSTKSRRKAAAAVFLRAVPTACCTAMNLPSRMRAPGSFSTSSQQAAA